MITINNKNNNKMTMEDKITDKLKMNMIINHNTLSLMNLWIQRKISNLTNLSKTQMILWTKAHNNNTLNNQFQNQFSKSNINNQSNNKTSLLNFNRNTMSIS